MNIIDRLSTELTTKTGTITLRLRSYDDFHLIGFQMLHPTHLRRTSQQDSEGPAPEGRMVEQRRKDARTYVAPPFDLNL
jgi:hypothetical protein